MIYEKVVFDCRKVKKVQYWIVVVVITPISDSVMSFVSGGTLLKLHWLCCTDCVIDRCALCFESNRNLTYWRKFFKGEFVLNIWTCLRI